MSRFTLSTLAEDAAYHLAGFAQGVLDVAMVLTLGVALGMTMADRPQTVQATVVAPPQQQMATNCAMSVLVQGCITEFVLQPQDS